MHALQVLVFLIIYGWFSPEVMLVHRNKEKKVFWEFDSIIIQNMSQICYCFVQQHGCIIT